MDSILTSIKKLLGIAEDYESFDNDIIMHINTVFSILRQIGIGSEDGFAIEDKEATWDDFITDEDDLLKIQMIKTYVYQKVRLLFDPPTNASFIEALNNSIKELEWRLYIEKDE